MESFGFRITCTDESLTMRPGTCPEKVRFQCWL